MILNRVGIAAFGLACVSAAGVGGYVATRQDVVPTALDAQEAPAEGRAGQPAAAVQETEALVTSPVKPTVVPSVMSAPAVSVPVAGSAPRRAAERVAAKRSAPQAQTSAVAPAAPLDRTWPSSTSTAAASAETPAPAPQELPAEPVRAPEPPAKRYSELVVAADSVIGLQNETALSSDRARVEDRVEAKVVRDVRVGGELAIPAGSRALGTVVSVEHGGRFKERARLGVRFTTLVLVDGTRLPLSTDTIYRYGDSPANGSAARIGGGAVAGAILGAIIGGSKGAAIGATTGAGAGTASVMTSDRSEAVFPAGAEITARILSPLSVTVEQE